MHFPHLLHDFGDIHFKGSEGNAVDIYEFSENACREGRTFLVVPTFSVPPLIHTAPPPFNSWSTHCGILYVVLWP